MKRKRHSPEQIIKKLREADAMLASGKTIGQACQGLEVSEQTWITALRRSLTSASAASARARQLMGRS